MTGQRGRLRFGTEPGYWRWRIGRLQLVFEVVRHAAYPDGSRRWVITPRVIYDTKPAGGTNG